MEKVIAIIGPTAVGKTALSFALAEHYGTDLISGDATRFTAIWISVRPSDSGRTGPLSPLSHRYC